MDHKKYLAKIGAKGGHAGKGTAVRREITRRAAAARWRKQHPRAKRISKKELTMHSSHANLAEEQQAERTTTHAQKTIHRSG